MASVNWRTHQGSAMKLSVMMASTRSLSLMESLSWSWTWSPGLQSRAGRQTLQHRCGSETSASAVVPSPLLIHNHTNTSQERFLDKVCILITVKKENLIFVARLFLKLLFVFFTFHFFVSSSFKHDFLRKVF